MNIRIPLKRKKEADFDSFVAFDFETTGVNSNRDAIIEVGETVSSFV